MFRALSHSPLMRAFRSSFIGEGGEGKEDLIRWSMFPTDVAHSSLPESCLIGTHSLLGKLIFRTRT